jgi:hypothetical protein
MGIGHQKAVIRTRAIIGKEDLSMMMMMMISLEAISEVLWAWIR